MTAGANFLQNTSDLSQRRDRLCKSYRLHRLYFSDQYGWDCQHQETNEQSTPTNCSYLPPDNFNSRLTQVICFFFQFNEAGRLLKVQYSQSHRCSDDDAGNSDDQRMMKKYFLDRPVR